MNITNFLNRHPYLYHLTDRVNYPNMINSRQLLSTSSIINNSNIENPETFLRSKRFNHTTVVIEGIEYRIRDQRPISEKVLARSLTNNWTNGDFIAHLNSRVFMWPNLNRLARHYDRYANENPIILRFNSADILDLNPNPEFCRLNSGATRCSSHWGGNAPERGPNTFLTADNYSFGVNSVAEVTFPEFCNLPDAFWIGDTPNGAWTQLTL